ncbi:MAG: NAD(P)/FAD-dependent oxidoreductase [Acidimicrobiales bacterium]|nr:NAD(P)/FAD-dependent oxidoreductase [Acidimicrobiales bacterium]
MSTSPVPSGADRDVPTAGIDGPDVDVLIVGAGVTGIYQLYRAREEGFSVELVEAGSGVGGTWFWNRYPGARFDSESYTYGYLFDRELFEDWEWTEHFAAQPETEAYLNHVVDRYDLRRHMRFDAPVTGAVWEEDAGCWTVSTDDGTTTRARFLVTATGVLSVPYTPDIPGRDDFRGVQHHTGRWPDDPVDFAGKRVAVVGTSSSGVQVVPSVVDEVTSLTVYQRSANWCTPLNNRPITDAEQEQLKTDFEQLREVLAQSIHGFHHPPNTKSAFDDPPEERWAFFEKMWSSPGFMKFTSNYVDILMNPAANAEWCEFIADKIGSIVDDPETAEKLIPDDHRYGEKRPPYVAGYFEAFNQPHVELVSLKETPMTRVTETGIETSDTHREHDIIVWATGFDFGTGAMLRMGIQGRNGRALTEHWADGPTTFLGVQTHGFPNLFFPGGPHAAAGNNPRYNSDQVDFVTDAMVHAREVGCEVIEVSAEAEERWSSMVERAAAETPFGTVGQYVGGNIPGKPKRYLLNAAGRPKLFKEINRVKDTDWSAFHLSPTPAATPTRS